MTSKTQTTEVSEIEVSDTITTEPPAGSWASVARMMAAGDDSDFDWDAWKDQMKDGES